MHERLIGLLNIILSWQVQPYLIRKNDSEVAGNDAYEGFCKDLLDELAKELKFNYTLYIPENSEPGELIPETGRYSGLMGELTEYVRMIIKHSPCAHFFVLIN